MVATSVQTFYTIWLAYLVLSNVKMHIKWMFISHHVAFMLFALYHDD